MKLSEAGRRYRDPSFLTPYEEEIYLYLSKGMTPKQISEAMGGKSSPVSVSSRIKVIKEKVALKEIMDAQDRRISWG